MAGINRAGPSGAYFVGHTDPEPASGGAHGSSSGASSSNSPRLPAPPDAPASQARDRREMLLRARPLSRQTREWVAQGMPPTAEAGVPIRPQESAEAAAPQARAEAGHTPEHPADTARPHARANARGVPEEHADADAAAPGTRAETRRTPRHVGATAHANSIVQQLVSAGANPAHTRVMFRNAMRGDAVAFSRTEEHILLEHFPDMRATGINRHSELAIELRGALHRADRRQAASAPARTPARSPARTPERSPAPPTPTQSSSASSQRSLFGRLARMMAPNQGRSSGASSASTSQMPADRSPPRVNQRPIRVDRVVMRNRGNNDADAALQQLTQQGVGMEDLRAALEIHIMRRRPLPNDIARALQSVGINPSVDFGESLVEHPLLNLSAALGRRLRQGSTAVQEPDPVAVAITSQFDKLRTVSKADAASNKPGFKDLADHPDDATQCLFGEELSLTNSDQQVIGLAGKATDMSESYSREANKDLVFMDMKKLAQFLAGSPEHPMNRGTLNAENIAKYAFRIVP
nr:E3 ubiquitin-protein ligase [Pseudomonas syringae]